MKTDLGEQRRKAGFATVAELVKHVDYHPGSIARIESGGAKKPGWWDFVMSLYSENQKLKRQIKRLKKLVRA